MMDGSRSTNTGKTPARHMMWWILTLSLPFSCVAVVKLGLLWFRWPVLSGVSAISNPPSFWTDPVFSEPALVAATVVAFAFHVALCSVALLRTRWIECILFTLAPVIVLVGVNCVFRPFAVDRRLKRVDSFQLGAQRAMERAGGVAKVRQDALALLATAPDTPPYPSGWPSSLPSSQWPRSFRALYPMIVSVDRSASWIDVIMVRQSCLANTFGYIITSERTPEPNFNTLHGRPYHEYWNIDDGIYLYEEW
jgi:hypothetical protein